MSKTVYNTTLYGVVVKNKTGGMTMDNFVKKNSAIKKVEEIINHIIENNMECMKVYLSEVDYDSRNNVVGSNWINNESELLFEN